MNITEKTEEYLSKARIRRPLTRSLVTLAALTYYGIMFLMALGMLIFSGSVKETLSNYYPETANISIKVYSFLIIAVLLHLSSCTGIVLIKFFDKKWGYLLFSFSAGIILILDLIFFHFDWLHFLINIILISLMSIVYVSMHRQERKNLPSDLTSH
jgi:hypothetical protein